MSKDALLKPAIKTDWKTPPDLVHYIKRRFDVRLDVCASEPNVCERYFSMSDDGLSRLWDDRAYCNLPYGPEIPAWIDHGIVCVRSCICPIVVYLVPARTDTLWFQDAITRNDLLVRAEFLPGRIKFVGATSSAPFPSMLLILEPKYDTKADRRKSKAD